MTIRTKPAKADTSYERHPLSGFWGDMPTGEFNALEADIAAQGLLEPITLFEGKVLDGWHRYKAWLGSSKKWKLETIQFQGDIEDAKAYVVSRNARRRQMEPRAIARIVVAINGFKPVGRPKKEDPKPKANGARKRAPAKPKAKSNKEMAEEAGVSVSTIKRAKREKAAAAKPKKADPPKEGAKAKAEDEKPKPLTPAQRAKAAETRAAEMMGERDAERIKSAELEEKLKLQQAVLDGDGKQAVDRVTQLEAELRAAMSSDAEWKAKHKDAEKARRAAERESKKLEKQVQAKADENAKLRAEKAKLEERVNELTAKVAELEGSPF